MSLLTFEPFDVQREFLFQRSTETCCSLLMSQSRAMEDVSESESEAVPRQPGGTAR